MKDELNTYGITNPDGATKQPFENDGKVSYDNDAIDYIREGAKSEQAEFSEVSETFDDPKVVSDEDGDQQGNVEMNLSSASSASSSMASASASVGGGLGALAGVVATGVMAAVVVVAVFLSTLAIHLSLVMADMNSLTFEV